MASGDVFAIKLHMTVSGQQARPGFYLVEGSGFGSVNPCEGAASAVDFALGGAALDGFSAACSLEAVEAQDIQPRTNRTFVRPLFAPIVGTEADANPVPPQDSMLIEWTTALKGGKGLYARRSRTYVPGIYSTGQLSGFLIADLQNALSAFASKIFDVFVTDGTQYGLYAVAFNPGTNPRTIREINPIVAFAVDNVVDIQRSRRPGRGI